MTIIIIKIVTHCINCVKLIYWNVNNAKTDMFEPCDATADHKFISGAVPVNTMSWCLSETSLKCRYTNLISLKPHLVLFIPF